MDNSIITGKYKYIFLWISVLLDLVDHKILKFITENFGVQRRTHFLLLCDLKKKKKKKNLKKRENQQSGFGVGTSRGWGRGRGQGRGRGRPACARAAAVAPLSSSAATLKFFFSRPPLSGAPRRTLLVDAARTFYCHRSAVVSILKPCHLYSIHLCSSSRRECAFVIPLCVRKGPSYCALLFQVCDGFLHCIVLWTVKFHFHSVLELRRWV